MTDQQKIRSFCEECGTSLRNQYLVGAHINIRSVYTGTLDHPKVVDGPRHHYGVESHLSKWIVLLDGVRQISADSDPTLAEAWASVSG